MSENVAILPDQPVAQLTAQQLESLVAAVVRRVVREELRRDYYVDERGVKVLYAAEEAAPAYLAELQEDYKAIQSGKAAYHSAEEILGHAERCKGREV
jgi:tRNA A37 threonylcarbamoyladenosine dehydratase